MGQTARCETGQEAGSVVVRRHFGAMLARREPRPPRLRTDSLSLVEPAHFVLR